MNRAHSIRIRLTAWYLLVFGGLLVVFMAIVYSLLAGDLNRGFDNSLVRSAHAIGNYFAEFAE